MCRSSYRWHFCLALVMSLLLAGCRQQMAEQPSYRPLDASNFFPDGRSARPLMPDTVSRDQTFGDSPLETGKSNGQDLTTMPYPVTQAVLTRGQQRYNIYCALCHDRVGTGQGVVVRRGYTQPPSFHIDRLRTAPVGHFFDVMTNGYGKMPSYAKQISVQDRWDIIAYIRALQLSQNASLQDTPPDVQLQLQKESQ
jgi:mono/diheme cytochrome c family protein